VAAARVGGRPVEIGIVIGLRTALGLDDLPGEIPAAGIVPREVIARMVAAEQPRLRLLVVDDDPTSPTAGTLVHRAVSSYRPTTTQAAHVRAAYPTSVGPGSSVRSDRCDLDHTIAWPAGATIVTNLAPFDRTWHNRKTRGVIHVHRDRDGAITISTALGQHRTVEPHDYTGARTGAPADAGSAAQTADTPAPF
jgi:hypothetical protein